MLAGYCLRPYPIGVTLHTVLLDFTLLANVTVGLCFHLHSADQMSVSL